MAQRLSLTAGAWWRRLRRLLAMPAPGVWALGFLVALLAVAAGTDSLSPLRGKGGKAAPRALSGRVVDPAGHAVAGARVTLVAQHLRKPGVDEIRTIVADAEGRFKVVAPGAAKEQILMLCVAAPGFALKTAIAWEPAVAPMKIALEEPTSIDVRTVDEAGQPVAGVRVQSH